MSASRSQDIDEILQAEEARRTALMAADAAGLQKLLAPEYVYVHASGNVEAKDEYIQAISSGRFRLLEFQSKSVIVTPYGDTALAAGEIFVTREEAGASKVSHFRFASLWARAQGGWRLAFWQNTTKV